MLLYYTMPIKCGNKNLIPQNALNFNFTAISLEVASFGISTSQVIKKRITQRMGEYNDDTCS